MLAALFVLGGLHGGVHTVHPVPDDSGGTLERCTPGSDALAAAKKAFDALDAPGGVGLVQDFLADALRAASCGK